jgi:glycerol-3-phosphate acyltransferase PlsY
VSTLVWILIAFSFGSLPFSVWVGRLAARTDIRRYGDHNPGATNVTRAAGWRWGILALSLDMAKGALPVSLAWYWAGLSGWALSLVALAPILGHAYSPFLGFRGGKAIAVSGGVWIGLTSGVALIYFLPLFLLWYMLIANDGWAVLLTLISFLFFLLLLDAAATLLLVWAGNTLILAWKHRREMSTWPHLRPWLRKALHL